MNQDVTGAGDRFRLSSEGARFAAHLQSAASHMQLAAEALALAQELSAASANHFDESAVLLSLNDCTNSRERIVAHIEGIVEELRGARERGEARRTATAG